ncbi:MAG: zf-TFIIB domain-containing protein [Phormidesmis sp.]
MRCPKEPKTELLPSEITEGLAGQCCPSCQGSWLPFDRYQHWQSLNAGIEAIPDEVLPLALATDYQPAPLDSRAGLCPECGSYLKRSRLTLQQSAFYVERCPLCEGIWCDAGEWDVLAALGLHVQIPIVFKPDWQAHVRSLEQTERHRLAAIEKLGPKLAERVFDLGNQLKAHPHGDFGVAYLMRKFDQ